MVHHHMIQLSGRSPQSIGERFGDMSGMPVPVGDQRSIADTLRVMKQLAVYRMQLTAQNAEVHTTVTESVIALTGPT